MTSPKTVKLKDIEDLIHVLNVAQLPLLHHVSVDSRHIYFIPMGIIGDVSIVYYVELEKPLTGKFILYNTFTGEIRPSSSWTSDSRYMVVPIVEVEEHNLFAEKIFFSNNKEKRKNKRVEKAKRKADEAGGSKFAAVLNRVKR